MDNFTGIEEILIKEVREFEILYNTNHQYYKCQEKRLEAWEEIAKEFGVTADLVKSTWDKLRRCYNNAMQRRLSRSFPSKRPYVWKHEEAMSFLEPFVQSKNRQIVSVDFSTDVHEELTNGSTNSAIKEEPTETHDDLESRVNLQDPMRIVHEELVSETQSLPNISVRRKPQLQNPKSRRRIFKRVPAQKQEARMDKSFLGELDENDLFFLSMSRIVKRLPTNVQSQIRLEICKLVSDREIDNCDD